MAANESRLTYAGEFYDLKALQQASTSMMVHMTVSHSLCAMKIPDIDIFSTIVDKSAYVRNNY